MAKQQVK